MTNVLRHITLRALKDATVRDAGPGYSKMIFLGLKEDAGDLRIEGYVGKYADMQDLDPDVGEDSKDSTPPPSPPPSASFRASHCTTVKCFHAAKATCC